MTDQTSNPDPLDLMNRIVLDSQIGDLRMVIAIDESSAAILNQADPPKRADAVFEYYLVMKGRFLAVNADVFRLLLDANRAMNSDVLVQIKEEIERVADAICDAFNVDPLSENSFASRLLEALATR